MGLTKQAKVLSSNQQKAMLNFLATTRYPLRSHVVFLLSVKAGLRAKGIASLKWSMVTDAVGEVSDHIALTDSATKGRSDGIIWLNKELEAKLQELKTTEEEFSSDLNVVRSGRGNAMISQSVVNMFGDWYRKMGFVGCSSHSGRRTFITNAAKKISAAGGSMRDVQMLARHSSLAMTQTYIEADVEAMKRVVNLV